MESLNPYAGPAPVLVLLEDDPWLMVIGSDTPRFVLYEDRVAIQVRRDDQTERVEHVTATLDQTAYAQLVARCRGLFKQAYSGASYEGARGVEDLPTTSVYLQSNGGALVTHVYGLDAEPLAGASGDSLPVDLRELVRELRTVELGAASAWSPQFVEVMLWPYEYAPDESIVWPEQWPSLTSPQTVQRRDDNYSIYLPVQDLSSLQRFLSKRRQRGAVELAGRKWAAAYRLVFPSEPIWRAAFSRVHA